MTAEKQVISVNSKVSMYSLSWDIKEILRLKIYVRFICFGTTPKHRGLKKQLPYPGPNPVGQERTWGRGCFPAPVDTGREGTTWLSRGSALFPVFHAASTESRSSKWLLGGSDLHFPGV